MNQNTFNPKEIYKYNQENNSYEIGISLDYYNEVYNEWDFSPDKNRDMDEDLFEYIFDCSMEIPLSGNLIINFYLPLAVKDPAKEEKSKIGVDNYMRYSLQKTFRGKRKLQKNILQYVLLGMTFLTIAYFIRETFTEDYILHIVIPEGFIIGGWVMLWEVFSGIFFEYQDIRLHTKHLIRIQKSKFIYTYLKEAEEPN